MKELILQLVLEKWWCLCLIFGEILSWDIVIASSGAFIPYREAENRNQLITSSKVYQGHQAYDVISVNCFNLILFSVTVMFNNHFVLTHFPFSLV